MPLIERYRDRLPVRGGRSDREPPGGLDSIAARARAVRDGGRRACASSSRAPTRPARFKDRGMTCAVSAAVRDGAKAVICASTGNTAGSAAAYAARAGITCAVIVPDGKIAEGKMAQTLIHGARVISLAGNFDQALKLVRELAERASDRARQLGQRIPHRRPEDGCLRAARGPRRGAGSALHPGRQCRQHHLLLAGVPRDGGHPQAVRLPGRGGGATRARPSRWSTPKRSPARSASATRCVGRTRSPR